MKSNSTRFFVFACATLIGFGLGWFNDTTAILTMIGIGFLNLTMAIEDIKK